MRSIVQESARVASTKKIHIGIPDKETRKEILQTQLDSRPYNRDTVASLTEEMVAADLGQLVDMTIKRALVLGGEQIMAKEVGRTLQELPSDDLLEDKSMEEGAE